MVCEVYAFIISIGAVLFMLTACAGGGSSIATPLTPDRVTFSCTGILLVIALAGILGPGVENVVIALSLVGWVGFG